MGDLAAQRRLRASLSERPDHDRDAGLPAVCYQRLARPSAALECLGVVGAGGPGRIAGFLRVVVAPAKRSDSHCGPAARNLSHDSSDDYFSDGLTDEIIRNQGRTEEAIRLFGSGHDIG